VRVSIVAGIVVLALLNVPHASGQVIREGPRECKGIALTFDLCPVRQGSGYDEALIQTLIERHIPATFFMSGRWMIKHAAEVQSLLAVPFFEVGTHGQVHAHLPELSEDEQRVEIQQAVDLLRTRHGVAAPLFRPPYGEYNDATIDIVKALGLRFILWNVVSGDPDPRLSRDQIVRTVRSRLRNGSIVVMHANGKGLHTREVVQDLYDHEIAQRGYEPLTVSDLWNRCRTGIDRDR
jgi:peptidoglycan/xylan/chitin deacetylase (PgdA/CDA1 family)